jgi:ABC-type branched-subunit amino acid transport system ATPase component/ABC-type branched-subunit amino acid transport system permease subunit
MRRIPFAAVAATIALLPLVVHNPYHLHMVETVLIYAILLSGLDVVVGCTGLVSLGHAGLFGVGAYTAGVLVLQAGAPLMVTLPAALAVAAACGALLALPALRVAGPHLAMATLAFAIIVQTLINEMSPLTAGPLGITLGQPVLAGQPLGPAGFYWLVAAVAAVALVAVRRVLRSNYGRAFEALRDSPVAADCMGVSAYRCKVIAFVLSAALAGLAGALHAWSEQYISPHTYGFELAVLFLLGAMIGGRRSRTGVLLGAAIIVLLPQWLDDTAAFRALAVAAALGTAGAWLWSRQQGPRIPPDEVRRWALAMLGSAALAVLSFLLDSLSDWRMAAFGLITLLVVYHLPDGIVGALRRAAAVPPPQTRPGVARPRRLGPIDGVVRPPAVRTPLLEAWDVAVDFGGLHALGGVDLTVRRGCIHGLIGPNGSGKSTFLDVLTGLCRPGPGASVRFNGQQLAGCSPARIARAGMARTFQEVQVFPDMSVLDNVMVGLHHGFRSGVAGVMLHTARSRLEETRANLRAHRLLRLVELEALAGEPARNLPYGHQRLLEIARALALDPHLLLLDEPAAGLTPPEVRVLTALIRRIRDHGVSVLLVEHHMEMVMGLCDTVTVLDFGRKIAEGTPRRVQADAQVIDAYLGSTRPQALPV